MRRLVTRGVRTRFLIQTVADRNLPKRGYVTKGLERENYGKVEESSVDL